MEAARPISKENGVVIVILVGKDPIAVSGLKPNAMTDTTMTKVRNWFLITLGFLVEVLHVYHFFGKKSLTSPLLGTT